MFVSSYECNSAVVMLYYEKLLFVIFTDKNRCSMNCYHFITVKTTINSSSTNNSYNVHNSL